ncbi:MAG: efflux RND transporter periplasmic adaptor subunit [Gammaproteobacteria bacterium]|nr:MAG: efflux RND transporter periplasmic adaptor subunit [Gammaproteobacteria bacterium]
MTKFFISLFLVASAGSAIAQNNNTNQLNCRIEPSTMIALSSPVVGVISEVLVDKNSKVEKGTVVARLEASVETATAELRRVQADLHSDVDAQRLQLDFSQRNLERVNNLYEKKAASFTELDKAKTERAIAAQQLQQAQDRKRQADLEYKRAQADLQKRTIVSPVSGIVVERFKQPGEHIDFEPVLKIAHLDPLKVEVFAPSSLYGAIKEGMKATVTPELRSINKTYTADVVLVDQVIDGPSNTFAIRLSIPNPDNKIPSGLKCKVSFEGVSLNLLDAKRP